MIDDMAAAESSIHILMFTMTPGDVSGRIVPVLEERAAAGVEVRMIVDRYGAKVNGKSAAMFRELQAAGVEIVVNDIFPIDRDGPLGDGSIDKWQDEVGNADHRKMVVIDGRITWIGGAGFEDQFEDGRYHDAYVRVTGDIARQAQLIFLTSFHVLGGASPEDGLERFFPDPADPGTIRVTLLHNVPGGYLPGTQAIREVIDGANERLEILNPYLTDPGMLDRVVAAGKRGVDVTVVAPGNSNNPPAADALAHNYGWLLDAGVAVYEYETIIHAKVIVADDTVVIGTINLDAWALYRNNEVALLIEDASVADAAERVLVDDALSRSVPAEPPGGSWDRLRDWFWDKLVYVL
jgi:cardiolipin synthase